MERPVSRVERAVRRGASSQVQDNRVVVAPGAFAEHSPFLMLSEDWFGAPGGFETHPHRGMQTVTIVLDGALEHRDHTGAGSVLYPGDVQWMTAGHGVLHSEMPYRDQVAHTLQLWLNLPARLKMIPARYVDQRGASAPRRSVGDAEIVVYAGRSGDIVQAHGSDWPMTLLDLRIPAGGRVAQDIASGDRGFLYVLEGTARIGAAGTPVASTEVAWLDPGKGDGSDTLNIAAETPFRGLLFAGPPIDEPVVAWGPFVMNTMEEIRQAYADYQADRFVA